MTALIADGAAEWAALPDDWQTMDLEDQLDVLLAVADDERLALCEDCGAFVPRAASRPFDRDDDERLCLACWDARFRCRYCGTAHASMCCPDAAYHAGRADAETMYRDNPDGLAYGVGYYRKRGELTDGHYERGIADRLQERQDARACPVEDRPRGAVPF